MGSREMNGVLNHNESYNALETAGSNEDGPSLFSDSNSDVSLAPLLIPTVDPFDGLRLARTLLTIAPGLETER